MNLRLASSVRPSVDTTSTRGGRNAEDVAREGHLEGIRLALAQDGEPDGGARLAAHALDRVVQVHALDRGVVDLDDEVPGLQARAERRCVLDRRNHLDEPFFHADLDAEAAEFALGADLELAERVLVEIRRVRIEPGKHAADRFGDELLVLDRLDVARLDRAEHFGKGAQLIDRQREARRLALGDGGKIEAEQNSRQHSSEHEARLFDPGLHDMGPRTLSAARLAFWTIPATSRTPNASGRTLFLRAGFRSINPIPCCRRPHFLSRRRADEQALPRRPPARALGAEAVGELPLDRQPQPALEARKRAFRAAGLGNLVVAKERSRGDHSAELFDELRQARLVALELLHLPALLAQLDGHALEHPAALRLFFVQGALLAVEIARGEQPPEVFPARGDFVLELPGPTGERGELGLGYRTPVGERAQCAVGLGDGAFGLAQLLAHLGAALLGFGDLRAQLIDALAQGLELLAFLRALSERQCRGKQEDRPKPPAHTAGSPR